MSDDLNWDNFINSVAPGSQVDKILGTIYGHALGDAVGLNTEFKFKRDAPKIEYPYKEPIRSFPICDWTDDTDHLILVMQSMISNKFQFDPKDIARRLKDWVDTGFEELGDTRGDGIGGSMNMVIAHNMFLEDPCAAASEIWHNSGKRLASNGSIMRTSIVGALPDPTIVEHWAANLSRVTHTDPRCVAACVLQSLIVGKIIYREVSAAENIDNLLADAVNVARSYIIPDFNQPTAETQYNSTFKDCDEELSHWVQLAYTKNIAELNLDDMVRMGYVFKCLACSIYSLQVIKIALKNSTNPSFKKVILKIASECGDADTNCAVAGATLGAYLGYSRLPQDWIIALPNRAWLNNIIVQFIDALNSTGKETHPMIEISARKESTIPPNEHPLPPVIPLLQPAAEEEFSL